MRLAFLTPGIAPLVIGGLQRHSFNLVKYLARIGVEIDLYHTVPTSSITERTDVLKGLTSAEKKLVSNILIPWRQGDRLPGHYIRDLKHFSDQAYQYYQRRPSVDFILGKSLTTWQFVEAKSHGKPSPPIGVNLHGFEMFQQPANIKAYFENLLLRPAFYHHACQADYLFSYGGRITDLIHNQLNITHERIIEIPGGIDSSWLVDQTTLSTKPIRFIFVGRYERRKGIQELSAAILQNLHWKEHATFRFIGPIPKAKHIPLPHVSYAGVIRDETLLQQELRQADILLCPSHSEGMPNVILEGMASGLAILATDVGAVQLLVDANNGILLSKVSIFGLSQGINHLLRLQSNQLQAMKQASLNRVQQFTWDRIAQQTLDAIQRIVSSQ